MEKTDSHQQYSTLTPEDVLKEVRSSRNGLRDRDAQERLARSGPNELPKDKQTHPLIVFLRQFNSPLIYIVMIAAAISAIIGHYTDAFFIMVVVFINALVGYLQEAKAQKALAALQSTLVPHTRVIREGAMREINASDVVVGDIIVLHAGDRIVADGRVIQVDELSVNEAVLTGESTDVVKRVEKVVGHMQLGDQKCMVFAGSHISQGEGLFVVTHIGSDTELGKIANLVNDQDQVTEPLKKKFAQLSRIVGVIVAVLIALFSWLGYLRGQSVDEIFVTATALVVSAIPEGLLPAVTIIMIFGARRLIKRKALVRRLGVTETIGAITTICTDKTGTLTQGIMQVSHILTNTQNVTDFDPNAHKSDNGASVTHDDHTRVLLIGGVLNDAFVENHDAAIDEWIVRGRPTDQALLLAAAQSGISREQFLQTHERVGHIAFSSARKFAAHFYENIESHDRHLFAIGAPEKIIAQATHLRNGEDLIDIKSPEGAHLMEQLDALTRRGLRVLACAERDITRAVDDDMTSYDEDDVQDLTLVGFIALHDPIRAEAKISLRRAQQAGIRPMIITGDHGFTARAIAGDLDWNIPEDAICTGAQVEKMSVEELRQRVANVSIFARVAPEHKIRIVHALQDNGEVVAMVGDGVNDAPALKASHVGISMGNGSDITKGVADIVLLNNSFSTIVDAIEQGRVIYENIRRTMIYLLADDFSELFVFFVAMFLGLPLPLVAAQILWINLVEDSFPNIALTTERDTKGLMDIPPRKPNEPILSRPHQIFMVIIFFVSGLAATALFVSALDLYNVEYARTMTFALISFDSLVLAYVLRSFRQSVWRRDIFSNKIINITIAISFSLLLLGIYQPHLAQLLSTVPLDGISWSIIVAVTILELIILEIAKRKLFPPVAVRAL